MSAAAAIDKDRTGGRPIPPPDIAGFPGLAGLLLTSPAAGKNRGFNASLSAADRAEWSHFDVFIDLNTILKAAFLVAIAYRLSLSLARWIRTVFCLKDHEQTFWRRPTSSFAWWKRHLVYPSCLGGERVRRGVRFTAQPAYAVAPTRIQALFVLGFVGVNVGFTLTGIPWEERPKVVVEQLRNRTGVLAMENMLPCFLFIMRSNPVMWILGISRESICFMHNWFGIIVMVQSLAHGGLWMTGRILDGTFCLLFL
jgi:hypothetical protein